MSMVPVIISIPHGGLGVPPEIRRLTGLSRRDLMWDGDAGTRDIYRISMPGIRVVEAVIARAFVDVNRDPGKRPPRYPDGVVKTITTYGKPVYREGSFPGRFTVDCLLERYYRPYHETLRRLARSGAFQLGLDCHSMADRSPPVSKQPGLRRPLVNLGDDGGRACPPALTRRLVEIFCGVFRLPPDQVTINHPFRGGFITRSHGGHPLPWIQVEINRRLYLRPGSGEEPGDPDPQRIRELNRGFQKILTLLAGEQSTEIRRTGITR